MTLHVPCAGYAAFGTLYDGVTTLATRGAGLTGAIDSKVGSIALFIVPHRLVTTNLFCGASAVGGNTPRGLRIGLSSNSAGLSRLNVTATNAAGATILDVRSAIGSTNIPLMGHAVLCSWDLAAGRANIYMNDEYSVNAPETVIINDTIDNTLPDFGLGGRAGGQNRLDGCLSEFWVDFTTEIDFSIATNRRKFFDSINRPIDKGASGELPTGVAPIIYSPRGDGINFGSGGNFTFTGTKVSC